MTLEDSIQRLYRWLRSQDYKGYEPHDFLESSVLRNIGATKSPNARIILTQIGRRLPVNIRPMLGIRKSENPKAIALILSGLLNSREKATNTWQSNAEQLVGGLLSSQTASGGWGYPFAWQSRTHYLPKNTPTVVATAFAVEALSDFNALFPKPRIPIALQRAERYFLEDLPRQQFDSGVAFGYAKDDPQVVFNASLLGASALLQISEQTKNESTRGIAIQAARFVAGEQAKNGSWKYGLEKKQTWTDSLHTAFILSTFFTMDEKLLSKEFEPAIERGLQYYKTHFFGPDGAPFYFADKKFPLDAHTAGSAIWALAKLGEKELATKVANWTIRYLQDDNGFFYYQITSLLKKRIPYLRWSNAWMFRGLSELLS